MSYQRLYINGIPVQNPFPSSTEPSPSAQLQYKSVEINQNTSLSIRPDTGYDGLSEVQVTTEVLPPLQGLTQLLGPGETTIKYPESPYYGISSLTSIVRPLNVTSISGTLAPGQTTTVTAPTSIDGYTQLTLSASLPNYQTKTTSVNNNANYVFVPDPGYDSLKQLNLTVDVPQASPNLQVKSLTILTNGSDIIEPDNGYDGLQSLDLTVAVPSPTAETITTTITQNTQLQITPSSASNLIGLVNLNIQVPSVTPTYETITTTLTQNTTLQLTPSSPNSAISLVNLTIDVPSQSTDKYYMISTRNATTETQYMSIFPFSLMENRPGETFQIAPVTLGFYRNTTLNFIYLFSYYTTLSWSGNDLLCRMIQKNNGNPTSYTLSNVNSNKTINLFETLNSTGEESSLYYLYSYAMFFSNQMCSNLTNSSFLSNYTNTPYKSQQIKYFWSSTSTSTYQTITLNSTHSLPTYSGSNTFTSNAIIFAYDTSTSVWKLMLILSYGNTITVPAKYTIYYNLTTLTNISSFLRFRFNLYDTGSGQSIYLYDYRVSSASSQYGIISFYIPPEWADYWYFNYTPPNAMEEE